MLHVWVNQDDQSDLSLALCIIASWHVRYLNGWLLKWSEFGPLFVNFLVQNIGVFRMLYFDLCYCQIFLFVRSPIKRRKWHRRKNFQNQEPCLMRDVYFKNMKWQAVIKVDKKQIHLGNCWFARRDCAFVWQVVLWIHLFFSFLIEKMCRRGDKRWLPYLSMNIFLFARSLIIIK